MEFITNFFSGIFGNNAGLETAKKALICSQIGIFGFFALALLSLFLLYNKENKKESDYGLLLLSLFFGCQLFMGIDILSTNSKLLQLFLSGFNSFCLLYSLKYFNIVKKKRWVWINQKNNWLFFSAILSIIVLGFSYSLNDDDKILTSIEKIPDVIFSIFIMFILAVILFLQFIDRRSTFLAFLSSLVCISLILTQYYYFEQVKEGNPIAAVVFNLLSLVLTSALGTIFLSLAFTWVFEEFSIKEKETEIIGLRQENVDLKEAQLNMTPSSKIELTKSEKEVLQLVCQGKTYREVAEARGVGEEGIISHVRNMERKLGVRGRDNLVEFAKKQGLCGKTGS